MKSIIEKSKFTIALVLLIQSISFLIMSIAQWSKRKSLAGAFLAISAIGGFIGTVLLIKSASAENERLTVLDSLCGDFLDIDDFNEEFEVPTSDDFDESEFDEN
ncbi:MAG: hypothetical protein E7633_02980 [Ruminococcaceae bacterium]|nr:hypothetical protein [Oscillospiraceae bacterium]